MYDQDPESTHSLASIEPLLFTFKSKGVHETLCRQVFQRFNGKPVISISPRKSINPVGMK